MNDRAMHNVRPAEVGLNSVNGGIEDFPWAVKPTTAESVESPRSYSTCTVRSNRNNHDGMNLL